jgi:hypothetical protein
METATTIACVIARASGQSSKHGRIGEQSSRSFNTTFREYWIARFRGR